MAAGGATILPVKSTESDLLSTLFSGSAGLKKRHIIDMALDMHCKHSLQQSCVISGRIWQKYWLPLREWHFNTPSSLQLLGTCTHMKLILLVDRKEAILLCANSGCYRVNGLGRSPQQFYSDNQFSSIEFIPRKVFSGFRSAYTHEKYRTKTKHAKQEIILRTPPPSLMLSNSSKEQQSNWYSPYSISCRNEQIALLF